MRAFPREEEVEVRDISDAGKQVLMRHQEVEAQPTTKVDSQSIDSNEEE